MLPSAHEIWLNGRRCLSSFFWSLVEAVNNDFVELLLGDLVPGSQMLTTLAAIMVPVCSSHQSPSGAHVYVRMGIRGRLCPAQIQYMKQELTTKIPNNIKLPRSILVRNGEKESTAVVGCDLWTN